MYSNSYRKPQILQIQNIEPPLFAAKHLLLKLGDHLDTSDPKIERTSAKAC